MATYLGANSGCHLKIKLATSVSTTSLAVAVGGEVSVALVIDEAYEVFGFFRRSRVNVAQQSIQREGSFSDQIGWVFGGL
jgi:hypothetical protein